MPSKRKKNKRRMRRVQAQRRALEEQHASSPPVKASPGIAASTPPAATPKKVANTPAPAPAKIPKAVPISVPIAAPTVEIPKVEPKPFVTEPVAKPVPVGLEAPEPESEVLEQTSAQVEVEVPALVTEEAPVIETPPVAPSIVEAAVVQEVEPIIPVTEITPPAEAPAVAPAGTGVQTVDTTTTTTETEQHVQMHQVCNSEAGVEVEVLAEEDRVPEVEMDVSVTEDTSISEPTTEATEEPVVEVLNTDQVSADAEPAADKVVTETVVESVVTEIPEPQHVTEAVVGAAAPAEEEEDEADVETLAGVSEGSAEPVTIAEDASAQSMEMPAVPDTIPETPVGNTEALVPEVKEAPATQSVADSPADDFVVTESASAVKETVAMSDTQTESVNMSLAGPECVAARAEEVPIDTEQTCLDVLSEEPKSEISDMPCQTQLIVESAQLSSVETAVETALNGHIVPEVSIEG